MNETTYPPIPNGTRVRTLKPTTPDSEWTEDVLKKRRWGVIGVVIAYHDAHGLCYEVHHFDAIAGIGCYDPSELEVANLRFEITVHVFIKPAVLNPEEKPVVGALHQLGFNTVEKIKMGKCHILTITAYNERAARDLVAEMYNKLLANPVTESFSIVELKVLDDEK